MVEAFEQLWNTLKSGDLQAILSSVALVSITFAPLIGKIASYKFNIWKEKYSIAKEEARKNIEVATRVSEEVKTILVEIDAFIRTSQEATTKTAELWEYILTNSTLTDAQKAYAKETYTKAIKEAKKIATTAIELDNLPKIYPEALVEDKQEDEVPSGI